MIVICKTPKNKEAFMKHYFEVHIPLAKKLPDIRKYIVSKIELCL
ncbi:MAG: EthD family reductase [Ilyomonas sp.]